MVFHEKGGGGWIKHERVALMFVCFLVWHIDFWLDFAVCMQLAVVQILSGKTWRFAAKCRQQEEICTLWPDRLVTPRTAAPVLITLYEVFGALSLRRTTRCKKGEG